MKERNKGTEVFGLLLLAKYSGIVRGYSEVGSNGVMCLLTEELTAREHGYYYEW